MKRSIKNILIFICIFLITDAIYLTMDYAKNHLTASNNPNPGMSDNMTPPEKPSNENNSSEDPNKESSSSSESSNNNMTSPDASKPSDSSNMTPPEKPSNENNSSSNDNPNKNSDNSSDNMTPPNMPSNNTPPSDMPNGAGDAPNNNKTSLTIIYYVAFSLECLILSSLIIYLIMSNFNKNTWLETFRNKDKITITVLSTIILTACLTYLCSIICTNYFLTTTNSFSPEGNNTNITYSSQNDITTDTTITAESYTSEVADENAIHASGNITATISNSTITKSGDSDGGDNTSFYGTNSAILATGGATLNLDNLTITTNATGANGVFSYGGSATTNNTSNDGTTINISNSTITTTKDNSGGIMTTGGGIMNATNLNIKTSSVSSAAIRTDRGGGTVTVSGGTYETSGKGSPTIYSTANVSAIKATLISNTSEGIVIEGKNSVTLEDCLLTATNNELNGLSTTYKNIFLYQSMSGDAANGSSMFTAKNSKITTNKGDSFYVTNTTAIINLTNNTIINNDSTGAFLRIQKDSWGTTGSNGGTVTLNMTNQTTTGSIIADSISSLSINLKDNSLYTGSLNQDNTAKELTLTIDATSRIKLTGDAYVTSLTNEDATNSNIDFNGYKLYVNGKSIN